jgi:hypothetical protein
MYFLNLLNVYSSIIISINGLDIIVTINSVYFEYIKILCKIFAKYIMPILKVYPNHLIIFLKIITNDYYFIFYTHTHIKTPWLGGKNLYLWNVYNNY